MQYKLILKSGVCQVLDPHGCHSGITDDFVLDQQHACRSLLMSTETLVTTPARRSSSLLLLPETGNDGTLVLPVGACFKAHTIL